MKTAGQRVDSAIEASLIGVGRLLKGAAVVGHRVLTLRPAKVEADLRSYLAMTALSHEAALVEAEAERDVYEPDELWCAARVREQEENFGRAQHPLYRQLQDEVAAAEPEPCPVCDYTDNGWCPCECHEVSAPGSLSGSERRPGVAESPLSPATPGQPQPRTCVCGRGLNYWTSRDFEYSGWCHEDDNTLACAHPVTGGSPVSPAGTGAQAGTGGSPKHLVTDGVSGIHSGEGATSDLLYAAANQLSELRGYRTPDSVGWRYLGELVPELRDRAAQFEAHGD